MYQVGANGLPILNSLSSAMGVAYIDFDGGVSGNNTLAGYDTDGDASTFSASEQDDIYKAWHDVSAHFAMFDINVTTVAPDKTVTPTLHILVTPDVTRAGAGLGNAFDNPNPGSNGVAPSSRARGRSTSISHEFGHMLGLRHQSVWGDNTVEEGYIEQYRGRDAMRVAPMMGYEHNSKFASWQLGLDTQRNMQDDLAMIRDEIVRVYDAYSGGTYTGDGFRPDDHGHKRSAATVLPSHTLGDPYDVMVQGVIERYTDKDLFRFDWAGGDINLFVEAERNLAAGTEFASSLGMTLKLIKPGSDPIDFPTDYADVDASLSVSNLAAGRYWIRVMSAGGYDDLGAYNLWVNDGLSTAASVQFAAVPEPSSLALLGLGGLMLARRRRG